LKERLRVAAETGFMIDDKLYELPSLDTLTMDELQVLYDYAGITLEDFAEPDDETPEETRERERRLGNPGLTRALMHIAYQRGNPQVRAAKVKQLIGSANVIEALAHLGDVEADADPPALTTEPEPSSPNGSVVSNESSGTTSENGSDAPDGPPAPIGITRSDTSSISAREISAA
jgi:hypothetical protein